MYKYPFSDFLLFNCFLFFSDFAFRTLGMWALINMSLSLEWIPGCIPDEVQQRKVYGNFNYTQK